MKAKASRPKTTASVQPAVSRHVVADHNGNVSPSYGDATEFARGLSPVSTVTPAGIAAATAADMVTPLSVHLIEPNPDNPRTHFADEQLGELAASIKEHGLQSPIIVRPHPTKSGRYQLVAGERRWRACQMADMGRVPAIVRDLSDAKAAAVMALENIEREQLNPIEEARAVQLLLGPAGYTQETIGTKLGKSQPWIANRLRLLKLPKYWLDRVTAGELPPTHARELVSWVDTPIWPRLDARLQELSRPPKKGDHYRYRDFQGVIEISVAEWGRALSSELHNASFQLSGWDGVNWKIKLTPDSRLRLGVFDIGNQEVATNEDEWLAAKAAAIAAATKRQSNRVDNEGSHVAEKQVDPKEHAKRRREQLENRIREFRYARLQRLCAGAIPTAEFSAVLTFFVGVVLQLTSNGVQLYKLMNGLSHRLKAWQQLGGEPRVGKLFAALQLTQNPANWSEQLVRVTLLEWFVRNVDGSPADLVSPGDLDHLADQLDIDESKGWAWSETYLGLHTIADLKELAAEFRVTCDGGKQAMVAQLQEDLPDRLPKHYIAAMRGRKVKTGDAALGPLARSLANEESINLAASRKKAGRGK